MSIENTTLVHFRHFRRLRRFVSLYYNIFPTHLFMQNKAKVKSAKINVSSFMTSKYVYVGHLVIQTTKPIQSQFKPIKANPKPIQSQFVERVKIDAKSVNTKIYEEIANMGPKKKPNKPNLNPIKACPELVEPISKAKCLWIWLNYERQLIGWSRYSAKSHFGKVIL